MPEEHLKLAIACAIVDKIPLQKVIEKLGREDPEQVVSLYNSIVGKHACDNYRLRGYRRHTAQSSNPTLNARKKIGLTLNEIAKRKRMTLATLNALLEHHGLLELAQYGLDQKRRMVTEQACAAGLGHNVNPVNRIGHLEGHGKAAIFPVFYEDRLGEIMWMLDFPGIRKSVIRVQTKKAKLAWLLQHHGYLPDVEVAILSGCSRRTVLRTRSQPPKAHVLQSVVCPRSLHNSCETSQGAGPV